MPETACPDGGFTARSDRSEATAEAAPITAAESVRVRRNGWRGGGGTDDSCMGFAAFATDVCERLSMRKIDGADAANAVQLP